MRSAAARQNSAPEPWLIRGGEIGLDRPVLMGILNVTPDSFSDGGLFAASAAAATRAFEMIEEGADLIDIGGESSRPGAHPISAEEEWRRIGPVLRELRALPVPISVDTSKASVARKALDAGASVINDVSALSDPQMAEVVARERAGIVLMHRRGDPMTMQRDVAYEDLIGEVRAGLRAAVELAVRRGCRRRQVVIDPGIGFGKSASGSLELLGRLQEFVELGQPVLVGPSRKSFLESVGGWVVGDRLEGTIAACVMAFARGARLFRIHDVRQVRRALDVAEAIRGAAAAPR